MAESEPIDHFLRSVYVVQLLKYHLVLLFTALLDKFFYCVSLHLKGGEHRCFERSFFVSRFHDELKALVQTYLPLTKTN